MGHRLSKIVTRTGDKGQTSLGSGARTAKNSAPIRTLGEVDELNSWIGVVAMAATSDAVRTILEYVQHDLFDLGAQICVPGTPLLSPSHLARIDAGVEALNARLPILKEFILPGGSPASAYCHVARTVCRRAERQLLDMIDDVQIGPFADEAPFWEAGLAYLNRLSDLLFIASRVENAAAGGTDIYWERGKSASFE